MVETLITNTPFNTHTTLMFGVWLHNVMATYQSVSQGRSYSDNSMCRYTEIRSYRSNLISNHSILTPGQPVQALTLQHKASGRVPTRLSVENQSHKLEVQFDHRYRGASPKLPLSNQGRHHTPGSSPQLFHLGDQKNPAEMFASSPLS